MPIATVIVRGRDASYDRRMSFGTIPATTRVAPVVLDERPLTLQQIVQVARDGAEVRFAPRYEQRVARAADALAQMHADERRVYGVTTGFGDNVSEIVAREDSARLQRNIVDSHAISVGAVLPVEEVRAAQLLQLTGLGRGHSGIQVGTLRLIRDLLNSGITPYVPGEGSVGYLGPEAHMARVLLGEGKAIVDGRVLPAASALPAAGLRPISLTTKEGLCLTNGSNMVTARAVLAVHDAQVVAATADVTAALTFEASGATVLSLDPRLHALKQHREQQDVAAELRRLLGVSSAVEAAAGDRVQDAYSLRVIPQLHGAVRRTIDQAASAILEEAHSVTDNPVLIEDPDDGWTALMGGNFDASFVGLQCDALVDALGVLAKSAERRVERLVNTSLSGLPAFLAGQPGVDNGFMIAQYTAAALYLELKGLAYPASVDSVTTSANQEDVVSNAYLAAGKARTAVDKVGWILSIELMCATQARELAGVASGDHPAQRAHELVRTAMDFAAHDRFFADDLGALERLVRSGGIRQAVG